MAYTKTIIHLSAIGSGGYSPHCLAAISITMHLLFGEYLLIILSTSVSCTCILTLWSTPVFDCFFFFSHDSYPLVGIFFCHGFPPKGKLKSLVRTLNNCGNKVDIIAFHYYPPDPTSTTSLNLRGSQ